MRLLDDNVAIRVFGPARARVTYRNFGESGAAGGYGSAARGNGRGL
jgi:hypothetical protein